MPRTPPHVGTVPATAASGRATQQVGEKWLNQPSATYRSLPRGRLTCNSVTTTVSEW